MVSFIGALGVGKMNVKTVALLNTFMDVQAIINSLEGRHGDSKENFFFQFSVCYMNQP